MYPHRSHHNIRTRIRSTPKGLCRCPDMMRKIRSSIGEVIGEEEWNWVEEDRSYGDRYQKGKDRMSSSPIAISRKGISDRVLRIKSRRDGGSRCEGQLWTSMWPWQS